LPGEIAQQSFTKKRRRKKKKKKKRKKKKKKREEKGEEGARERGAIPGARGWCAAPRPSCPSGASPQSLPQEPAAATDTR
jgi:hypothetical protein